MSIKNIEKQNPDKECKVLIVLMIPGVPKKTLHVFKSLFFDVMWSKYYKIFRGCSGIIF